VMQITTAASDNYTHYSERIVGKPSLTRLGKVCPSPDQNMNERTSPRQDRNAPQSSGFVAHCTLTYFALA